MTEQQPSQPIFRSQDVPREPGVYVYRNRAGEVIYVGKARNLRSRMSSYFRPSGIMRSDPRRRALIHSIASYEVFKVSSDSEALLLEERFIKEYNPRYNVLLRDDKRFLHICIDMSETYPRLGMARIRRDDNRLYFGPFPQAAALRETVEFLTKRWHLRSCTAREPNEETRRHCLEHVLRECSSPCIGAISPEEYRARLDEVLEVLRGEGAAAQLVAELSNDMQALAAEMKYEEAAALRDMISNLKIVLEPARRFRSQTLARRLQSSDMASVEALQEALGMTSPPLVMECFDMSNISGRMAVGSMVCFRNGRPASADYRRFRIRSEVAADDTAFMSEVLTRRYGRLLRENLPLPDLIILDGGQGQLNTALRVFAEIGMPPLPMLGLAKRDELVILPGRDEPLALPRDGAALKLLQAIRDEAHRFANNYHRELRNKRIVDSILSDIPGIGAVRRQRLLKSFGSVRAMARLTPEEIADGAPGIGLETARKIVDYLRQRLKN
ncbi:MAG: excinuclease ABC subunit UvrC [Lentisphaerae bacterium]|nr:excinuclease ABC subunit UvrC [Lentisphaerota bacterium]